jgi:hypothetical protein
MKCIRIGFGKIAQIHEEHLRNHGVTTIGVVEVNSERLKDIKKLGFNALDSIQAAIALKPDFYDICTPTHTRLEILRSLCLINPYANILVEKPFCDYKDIEEIQRITKNHLGKISINENYASSNVTTQVLEAVRERNIKPNRVIVESTKNRGEDFQKGRFIDLSLGALGYEGSHLLALVGELGDDYGFQELIDLDIDTGEQPLGRIESNANVMALMTINPGNYGHNQGGAFIRYKANNSCVVDLYTSMTGSIGYPCPPYALPGETISSDDSHTRYRIFRVDGIDDSGVTHQIVGFYEPIKNMQRSQARIAIFKDWALEHLSEEFTDNTMSQHLQKITSYFRGETSNPYDADRAIEDVKKLHEWAIYGWNSNQDSEEYLGRKEIALDRLEDAKRFKGFTKST